MCRLRQLADPKVVVGSRMMRAKVAAIALSLALTAFPTVGQSVWMRATTPLGRYRHRRTYLPRR
jgi:hypothetical protein